MKSSVENIPHEIQPNRTDVVRLIQLTDSHIFANKEDCLLGLNTRESFEAICERIALEEWRPDVMLATGDLSQDATVESYEYLAKSFKAMDIPTFWIPGNHDNPVTMAKCLTNNKVFAAKQILLGQWQIILLDSSVKGKVHGFLAEDQLSFLEKCLKANPNKHCLISLHHQPLDIGSKWLDQIGLRNKDEFTAMIKNHPQVKAVIWGHIHQETEQMIDGVLWIATPSTCVQFTPKSQNFSAGTEAPGYRYLNLYPDGKIDSVVHRVDNMVFTVDYSIKGY